MRFGFFRRNGVGEARGLIGTVTVHESAGNGVNGSERVRLGRTVRSNGAAKDLYRRRWRQFCPGKGIRWEGEGKLHAVASLLGGEIPDGGGNWRRGRNGLAGSAAAGRKQKNAKEKLENGNDLRGAFFDVGSRPFSIFHFPDFSNYRI